MEKKLGKREANRLMNEWYKASQKEKIKMWPQLVPYINAYKDLWTEKQIAHKPKIVIADTKPVKPVKNSKKK